MRKVKMHTVSPYTFVLQGSTLYILIPKTPVLDEAFWFESFNLFVERCLLFVLQFIPDSSS